MDISSLLRNNARSFGGIEWHINRYVRGSRTHGAKMAGPARSGASVNSHSCWRCIAEMFPPSASSQWRMAGMQNGEHGRRRSSNTWRPWEQSTGPKTPAGTGPVAE
jgi:hypothetical protein